MREYILLLAAAFCLVCAPEVPTIGAQGSKHALEADIVSKVHARQDHAELDEARLLDPRFPHSHCDLALVYLSEKPYAQAVLPLQTCLGLNPQNAEAHLLLGRAYHKLNRTAPAIEEFKQALSLSTRLPLVHYRLGYAFQSWGNLS